MKILQLKRFPGSLCLRTLILFISIALIVFAGCKKEGSNGSTASQQEEFASATSESDAEAEVTFDGYYVNDTKVEGTHTVTNTSTQAVKSFTIEVANAKLTHTDGSFLEWNSTRTISQTDGMLTVIPLDDVFNLTGHANGMVEKD